MISWETSCRFLKSLSIVRLSIPVNGFVSKAYTLRSIDLQDETLKLVFFKPTKNEAPLQNGKRLDRGSEGVEQAAQRGDVVCPQEGYDRAQRGAGDYGAW